MFNLLTPLDEHYDNGFGAVADSFKEAADVLCDIDGGISPFHGHLPISFLYRHSIELYIKASILIIHKYFKKPFGKDPYKKEHVILVKGKWTPIYNIHSTSILFKYLIELFSEYDDYLKEYTQTNWEFVQDTESVMREISQLDDSSTYFRYPVTKNRSLDKHKYVAKQTTVADVMTTAKLNKEPMKTTFSFSLNNKPTQIFIYDNTPSKKLIKKLRDTTEVLEACHAALMGDLVGEPL